MKEEEIVRRKDKERFLNILKIENKKYVWNRN